MKRLSLVVPTYNETDLAPWLASVQSVVAPLDAEVLIVDDSGDDVHAQLRKLENEWVRVLPGTRRGKGDAIRVGTLAAEGHVIVALDADIEEEKLRLIPEFVRLIEEENYDVVIAERRSRLQYRNAARFLLSIGLFLAQRLFIFHSTRFFDTQCGFKAYRRDAARRLVELQTVHGGMVDIEYLYIATKLKMRIAQVPVTPMRELRPSKLRVLRCLVHDPAALLRVKWNGLVGRYR
jgi:dolichyl-phosphate beta-glucosyltransferase